MVVVAIGLSACSSETSQSEFPGTDDVLLSQTDAERAETVPVLDVEEPTPIERYETGELSFGDPADEGFAPIEDIEVEVAELEEEDEVPVEAPNEVLPETPVVEVVAGEEILDAVDPVDEAPTPAEAPRKRDGKARNDIGELVTIDEAASVACGNAEIAITELDEGNLTKAADHKSKAATFATDSATIGMNDWATSLSGSEPADATTLVAFLKACSAGGYEL